jgi:hypothetical protein
MGTKVLGASARFRLRAALVSLMAAVGLFAVVLPAQASAKYTPRKFGELDCNGKSTAQQSVKRTMLCTDIRGIAGVNNRNTWDGRFYDNGLYIGHDEPDMTFLSNQPGSGNNVTWTETIPLDPSAAPTDVSPGHDVSHWFELTPAPWFSMALCDSNSYPQRPCAPESDGNAPKCLTNCTDDVYPGAGSTFMEMQLYPPGMPPFADSLSCDDSHWCAALTIDSLECTVNFAYCNSACEEPVNFAFIQRNGVPTGPPSPQEADLATETPNSETLLMNPGDTITFHMWDAPVPGHPGENAFEVMMDDLTTGQSGFMQASAVNGFHTTSLHTCAGTPHNFQPEYNTAARNNIVPWAALETNVSTEFETGHWEACTSITDESAFTLAPGITDPYWARCHGPYEETAPGQDNPNDPETTDAFCYPQGDTHGALHTPPDTMTGCTDFVADGDLDFDGTPYWPEWPTGSVPTSLFPGSFVEQLPTSSGGQYGDFFIQTDIALSESTCMLNGEGCSVPPPGPGHFYPYWSRVTSGGGCTLEFGNVSSGTGVNDFGQDAQYGENKFRTLGYPEFIGPVRSNACTT